MDNEQQKKNLEIFNFARSVPDFAKKEIKAGKLKGYTNISPQWRIEKLTELFGPAGIGWVIENIKYWTSEGMNECVMWCSLDLKVFYNGQWSLPINGIGGSKLYGKGQGDGINDECIDGDCEILTPTGWVKFRDYDGRTPLMQYDKQTEQLSFAAPVNFIRKVSEDTYKKGDIIMTGGHRILYEDSQGRKRTDLAESLSDYEGRAKFDIRSGFFGPPVKLSPMQKLGLMLQADGTKYQIRKNGNILWSVDFAKKRKIEKAKELLSAANVPILYEHVSERADERWGEHTQIRFELDNTDYKILQNFLPLANYSDILEEAVFWDGSYSSYVKDEKWEYMTTSYDNATYMQTVLFVSGRRSEIYRNKRKGNHNVLYRVYRRKDRTRLIPVRRYGVKTEVYCVEVPTTYFVVRKGDKIFVTGNCAKMAQTDAMSVAMKNLGFAADVYYGLDDTKYRATQGDYGWRPQPVPPQPVPPQPQAQQPQAQAQQPRPQVTLEQAVELARNAATPEEVVGVWNAYGSMYGGEQAFKFAIASNPNNPSRK